MNFIGQLYFAAYVVRQHRCSEQNFAMVVGSLKIVFMPTQSSHLKF